MVLYSGHISWILVYCPVSTSDWCSAVSAYVHFPLQCRVAHRRNEVANNEATAFSIFYNNSLFFFLFMLIAYFFRLLHPGMYPQIAKLKDYTNACSPAMS